MNLSKALWTLGSVIGAQQAAKAVRGVELNDILGVIGLERRPSAFSRALPALGGSFSILVLGPGGFSGPWIRIGPPAPY